MEAGQNKQGKPRRSLLGYKVFLLVIFGYVGASAIALLSVYPFRDKKGQLWREGASAEVQGWTAGTVVVVGAGLALILAIVYLRAWRRRTDPTVMTSLSGEIASTFPGYLIVFCGVITFWTLNERGNPWDVLFIAASAIVAVSLLLRIATWATARRTRLEPDVGAITENPRRRLTR